MFFVFYLQVVILFATFAAVHCVGLLQAPLLAAPIVSTGVSSSSRKQDVREDNLFFKYVLYFLKKKFKSVITQ